MKSLSFLNAPPLYIEIGQSSLKMLDGDDGLELSLDRQENGRLTPPCAERLASSINVFLKKKNWGSRSKAFCAIGSRGVSLRRLELPNASKDELERLLLLQIEREFPVSPDELAWGWQQLGRKQDGNKTSQEVVVAAVKKEALQEYTHLLAGCGINPVFTFGVFARNALLGHSPSGNYAILDIGRFHSEFTCCENGNPVSTRVIPWGGETITQSIQKRLGISHAEAEKLKLHPNELSNGGLIANIQGAVDSELTSLAATLRTHWTGTKLYLCGETARLQELAPRLAKLLGNVDCELLKTTPGEGRSAAIFGLKKNCELNGGMPPLLLESKATGEKTKASRPAHWKWAALAALLLFSLLVLRYAEPLIQKQRLARKIEDIKAYREKLPQVDRELAFLQYLKTNQPPYLDPLALVANASPSGTRVESLGLSRRGELSLRATFRTFEQVVDFRSKMINSGYFTNVVVEEQTPSADRQKMTVRITAQWSPSADGKNLDTILKASERPKPGTARAATARPRGNTNATPANLSTKTNTAPTPKERKE